MDNSAQSAGPLPDAYRCPGQRFPISRAVHLARLAAFYPDCRTCEHRSDTSTLSPRKIEQLASVAESRPSGTLFHAEGIGGVYLNDLTPADTRRIAAAFAGLLSKGQGGEERGEWAKGSGEREETCGTRGEGIAVTNPPSAFRFPRCTVVLGGDGRALTAELLASASDGLRFAGCDVIDIGQATSACLAYAVQQTGAAGGLLVGNPGSEPHAAGLTFWDCGGMPISAGSRLEQIRGEFAAGPLRPTSGFGGLRHVAAAGQYVAAMAAFYHGMRPLRVVVQSASRPLLECLRQLASRVACELVPCRVVRRELPRQIDEDHAHFAVEVCGNGETCCVWDELGREVDAGLLLRLLAFRFRPPETIVVDANVSRAIIAQLEADKFFVVNSDSQRADLAAAMRTSGAVLGAGAGGRFWHRDLGVPLADALMTITALLVLLSRSDAPLSRVLDQLAAGK